MYPSGRHYIQSKRLQMLPATRDLTQADLAGHRSLEKGLGAAVPDNWPPAHYSRSALEYVLAQLAEPAEQGWSTWYLLSREPEQVLQGVCGFKARPDKAGSVEISYAILDQFQGRGLATEAVARLVEWAFTHPAVVEVSAETLPHLRQSIRVLEKNGFQRSGAGSEYGVVRYVVKRSWSY